MGAIGRFPMQASEALRVPRNRHGNVNTSRIHGPMSTDEFWAMVQQTRRDPRGEAPALAALTAELETRGDAAIEAFEAHVAQQLAALDTLALRDVANQLWVLSDEAWLHFRAWCVSRGAEFVAQVQREPGRVLRKVAAEAGGPFDAPKGELFLYCAEYARIARSRAVA